MAARARRKGSHLRSPAADAARRAAAAARDATPKAAPPRELPRDHQPSNNPSGAFRENCTVRQCLSGVGCLRERRSHVALQSDDFRRQRTAAESQASLRSTERVGAQQEATPATTRGEATRAASWREAQLAATREATRAWLARATSRPARAVSSIPPASRPTPKAPAIHAKSAI